MLGRGGREMYRENFLGAGLGVKIPTAFESLQRLPVWIYIMSALYGGS